MDITTTKIIALVLLGGVSLILGFLPLKLGKWIDLSNDAGSNNFWKRTITSVLLCYGGGVLLATSFVHMLPEVRESIESTSYDIGGIPAAEIFFCCGFFLIYLIEEVVHCVCDARVHTHDEATLQVHKTFTVHSQACEAGMTDMQLSESQENIIQKDCHSPPVGRRRTVSTPPGKSPPDYKTFTHASPTESVDGHAHSPSHSVAVDSEDSSLDEANHSHGGLVQGHGHSHSHGFHSASSLRDFLTVLALSCHAVFEGLAIGLENESEAVWTLFAAVATHKYVISFCVGLELITAKTPVKLFCVYMCVFSLVSPLGVGIGIGISNAASSGSDAYTFSVAILQALAGGTLIYVVVFEVLQREKSKSVSGLAQLTFVVLGFCTLMCIEIFAGHDHEHGPDHGHNDTDHLSAQVDSLTLATSLNSIN